MKKFILLALLAAKITWAQKPVPTYCPEVPKPKVQMDENTIYNVAGVDVKPEFPGGNNGLYSFINSNFRTDNVDLNGKIFAMFIIEKDGTLSDIKIIRDLGHGTKEEALRVLKLLPKWTPGKVNGQNVRTLYSIPLTVKNGVGGNNAQVRTVEIQDKNTSPKKTK